MVDNTDLTAMLSVIDSEARTTDDIFTGPAVPTPHGRAFGGQVLGQALTAAGVTAPHGRELHSMHGYFLRPGDASLPVVYQVERTRDGGSFSTRRVVAVQKGKPIFFCSASFQYDEEGFHHQSEMPDVPGPEDLKSETELARMVAPMIPERMRERAISDKPIEIRPVTLINPFAPQPCEPLKYVWFRAAGELPDDPQLHKYLLAYASDFNLLTTSMQPHGVSVFQKFMQVASLDHSLWFHRNLRLDDWLLYAMDSPWAGNARGFSRASIYNRQGELVASVAQEGLTRVREDWK